MEFILKNVLRALLQSTSEPLSLQDIQGVLTRYHRSQAVEIEDGEAGAGAEGRPVESEPNGQKVMGALIAQVPSLITDARIRETMDQIGLELLEVGEVCRLQEGPQGYRLVMAPEYADWVRLLRNEPRPQRLSASALETLAVVAYRQPVTRAEIEAVRGVSSDSALNRLLERELVSIVGRAELPGRPLQYGTTDRFLELCGMRSIEELPASDVLSTNDLNEWIRRATGNIPAATDVDVGLAPEYPEAAGGSAEPPLPNPREEPANP